MRDPAKRLCNCRAQFGRNWGKGHRYFLAARERTRLALATRIRSEHELEARVDANATLSVTMIDVT